MIGKEISKTLSESKNQIFWLFGLIPLIKIKHSVTIIPQGKTKIIRFRRMYWLLCFIPLFSTERCYEPDRELCKQKYDFGFPNF